MTILTMTFLGLETRNDLPKVTYMTALDYFVAITFAFIFATIVQFAIVHFYTKVGSGEYYIPPIEILEDIKAFHRARQAEKAGYTGTLNSISDSDDEHSLSSPSHILSENQWQEENIHDNFDNYISRDDDNDDNNDNTLCNAVIIDPGQDNSQVATVASLTADFVTRSRLLETSLHPDVMHLTSDTCASQRVTTDHNHHHNNNSNEISNINSLCQLREYSSSAPPISINGTLVLPTINDTQSNILPSIASASFSRRISPNSRATCSSHVAILSGNRINSHRLDNQIKSPGVMASKMKSLAPGTDERDFHHQYPLPSAAAAAAASSSSSSFCPIHVSLSRYSFNCFRHTHTHTIVMRE